MLSGFYYAHEGRTQSKEPPPKLNDQPHLHPHKPTLPRSHTGLTLHPKDCTEAPRPKCKD